jgi:hypothetical protein
MTRLFPQFGRFLATMLEQLAVRTEGGRLVYHDISCMSWVDICEGDAASRERASMNHFSVITPEASGR